MSINFISAKWCCVDWFGGLVWCGVVWCGVMHLIEKDMQGEVILQLRLSVNRKDEWRKKCEENLFILFFIHDFWDTFAKIGHCMYCSLSFSSIEDTVIPLINSLSLVCTYVWHQFFCTTGCSYSHFLSWFVLSLLLLFLLYS